MPKVALYARYSRPTIRAWCQSRTSSESAGSMRAGSCGKSSIPITMPPSPVQCHSPAGRPVFAARCPARQVRHCTRRGLGSHLARSGRRGDTLQALRFAGVQIVTLAEGEISELHVGLKGTMNALFLKDLAAKTHRGLRGRVEKGKAGGGLCYGYDEVKRTDSEGEPVRGERKINEAEAVIAASSGNSRSENRRAPSRPI